MSVRVDKSTQGGQFDIESHPTTIHIPQTIDSPTYSGTCTLPLFPECTRSDNIGKKATLDHSNSNPFLSDNKESLPRRIVVIGH
ncbi:hypothetical protein CEP54_009065 [Fusarium duplospermum]|uniref:Uncharacterized protein n=1 Tax=Fusarium duplospermum TaxID=1325734 RepID=A0A428PSE9_9HYPO|nr:hypothetical protein CEP54_009065 [Fusarium duplospermum]